jgi:tRNA(adenine34) deaminase
MTKREKMQTALGFAADSLKNGECPIGAALFLGDELICGCGSEGETKNRYLTHAEMKVLWEADRRGYGVPDRKRMQLYTTLEPCLMCMGAAMSFYLGEIVYALESEIDGAVFLTRETMKTHEVQEIPSYTLPVLTAGILRLESLLLLESYAEAYPDSPSAGFCRTLVQQARRRDENRQ